MLERARILEKNKYAEPKGFIWCFFFFTLQRGRRDALQLLGCIFVDTRPVPMTQLVQGARVAALGRLLAQLQGARFGLVDAQAARIKPAQGHARMHIVVHIHFLNHVTHQAVQCFLVVACRRPVRVHRAGDHGRNGARQPRQTVRPITALAKALDVLMPGQL